MSNTKHSIGPWFITEGPTYGCNSTLKVESPATGTRAYGMVICTRNITTEDSDIDKESRANFRLIKQAPELLSICESILAEVDYEGLKLESSRVAKLRSVIAKATAQ